jgi:hypothetical protein
MKPSNCVDRQNKVEFSIDMEYNQITAPSSQCSQIANPVKLGPPGVEGIMSIQLYCCSAVSVPAATPLFISITEIELLWKYSLSLASSNKQMAASSA